MERALCFNPNHSYDKCPQQAFYSPLTQIRLAKMLGSNMVYQLFHLQNLGLYCLLKLTKFTWLHRMLHSISRFVNKYIKIMHILGRKAFLSSSPLWTREKSHWSAFALKMQKISPQNPKEQCWGRYHPISTSLTCFFWQWTRLVSHLTQAFPH